MSRIGSNAWCYIRLEIRNTAKPWLLLILLLLHGGLSAGCATTQPPSGVIFVSEQAISDHLPLDRSADAGLLDVWQVHGSDSVYVTHYSVRHGGTYRLSSGSPISESVEPRSSSENWIDAHGRVLELPPFARTLKSHGLVTIDRQSGLFISNHRDETNCRVGHMERPDGWLIDMPLEQSGFRPYWVAGDWRRIYVFDYSDFRLLPMLQKGGPNCWVFEPSAEDPTRYVRVDQFRLDSGVRAVDPHTNRFVCSRVTPAPGIVPANHGYIFDVSTRTRLANIPRGHIALFMDPDWLTPRITTLAKTKPTHEP